jgi:hypothetical protein
MISGQQRDNATKHHSHIREVREYESYAQKTYFSAQYRINEFSSKGTMIGPCDKGRQQPRRRTNTSPNFNFENLIHNITIISEPKENFIYFPPDV